MHDNGNLSKGKKIAFAFMFWIVSLTWGCLSTVPGLLVSLILLIRGHKAYRNGCSFIIEFGGNWGGLNMGAVSFCGSYHDSYNYWFEHTRRHEFGHSIQTLVLGPLQFVLVSIPSMIRYWYQRIRTMMGKSNYYYDYAIFEYTASKYGYYWIGRLEDSDMKYTYRRK